MYKRQGCGAGGYLGQHILRHGVAYLHVLAAVGIGRAAENLAEKQKGAEQYEQLPAPRRNKLHILQSGGYSRGASAASHPFRCSSFTNQTRWRWALIRGRSFPLLFLFAPNTSLWYGLCQLDTSNPVLIPVVAFTCLTSSSVLTVLRSGAKGQRV